MTYLMNLNYQIVTRTHKKGATTMILTPALIEAQEIERFTHIVDALTEEEFDIVTQALIDRNCSRVVMMLGAKVEQYLVMKNTLKEYMASVK